MMQRIALSYESPIYGRRTGQIHLDPLKYVDFRLLFKDWNEEDIAGAYGVLGGIPRYAEEFDIRKEFSENIKTAFLDKDAFLYKISTTTWVRFLKIYQQNSFRPNLPEEVCHFSQNGGNGVTRKWIDRL